MALATRAMSVGPHFARSMAGSRNAHAGNVRGLMKLLADPDMSIDALTRSIAIAADVLAPVRAEKASCVAVKNSCNICERCAMCMSRFVRKTHSEQLADEIRFMAAQQWVCHRQSAITFSRPKSLLQYDAGLTSAAMSYAASVYPRW